MDGADEEPVQSYENRRKYMNTLFCRVVLPSRFWRARNGWSGVGGGGRIAKESFKVLVAMDEFYGCLSVVLICFNFSFFLYIPYLIFLVSNFTIRRRLVVVHRFCKSKIRLKVNILVLWFIKKQAVVRRYEEGTW